MQSVSVSRVLIPCVYCFDPNVADVSAVISVFLNIIEQLLGQKRHFVCIAIC